MNLRTRDSAFVWCFVAAVAGACLSGVAFAADVAPVGASPVGGVAAQGSSVPAWMLHLPAVNACFNTLSTVLLTAGFIFIRLKNQTAHRNCMLAALASSALFLAGYLTYHFVVHSVTPFREPQWFRPIYLTILLTHTVLAVVIVPMIVVTLILSFSAFSGSGTRSWISLSPVWVTIPAACLLGSVFWLVSLNFPQGSKAWTILSGCIAPIVLFAVILVLGRLFRSHKAIARWTWPLWMYVSVTGVVIYLLLYQIFPQR